VQASTIRTTKRLLSRALTTIVAALVVIAAISSRPGWYEDVLRWLQPPLRSAAPPKPIARSGPIATPVNITPMRPEGNDSSISSVARLLILVRTERGANSREGFAQIGLSATSPQTYRSGAILANGARLTEIYDHYVTLERDGRAVRLYLQGEGNSDSKATNSILTVGGANELIEAPADSREELTDYLRPSPVFVGGKLSGYSLFAGRKDIAFSQLGLQAGDVLTHVNGEPVSDTSDSLTMLHPLINGEVVSVEIDRQGTSQTLSLDGSVLRAVVTSLSVRAVSLPTGIPDAISSATLSSLLTRDK
jgi:hypothetical protein